MKALDQTIDHLLADLKNITEGEYGELVNLRALLNAERIEEFMNPETDTPDDGPIIIEEPKMSVLGRYYHMKSPGTVILYKRNIKKFFDTLLREVLHRAPFMTRADLAAAARLVASKTYYHELFHFDCNVLRLMFGTSHDKLKEEALAVARSRMLIAADRKLWQSQIGRMNSVVYGSLMDFAFQFKSPGYRDWPNYADEVRFKEGLLDYLKPPKADFLMISGVPLQEIIFSLLGNGKDGQGFVEMAV